MSPGNPETFKSSSSAFVVKKFVIQYYIKCTVILLIGSGWSFVKPFLTDREKKMILGVIVLQVINNIAIVVLTQETEGEIAFDRWTAILHLVDIVCCCAVLLPFILSE